MKSPDTDMVMSSWKIYSLPAGLLARSTRLRILAVLARSELTVSELCRVLGQTQPRVSRHLRLLCEAGLLDRNAQGTSASSTVQLGLAAAVNYSTRSCR